MIDYSFSVMLCAPRFSLLGHIGTMAKLNTKGSIQKSAPARLAGEREKDGRYAGIYKLRLQILLSNGWPSPDCEP